MRFAATANVAGFFAVLSVAAACSPLSAAESPGAKKPPQPKFTMFEEPCLPEFSVAKAVEYLDAGAQATENGKCITCHASFAYLMARPALPIQTEKHDDVRIAVERWVSHLEELELNPASDPRRRAEAVMSGAVLAQHDAATTGKLQPVTRRALDLMWRVQRSEGGYDWLKPNNEPPSAIDDHFGATMAAIGAGAAIEGYAEMPAARDGLDKLRRYFEAHPPTYMHQRAMLLLADRAIGGLMDDESRRHTVADLLALQRPDGGWAMASLGDGTWQRKDKTPQDLTTSDGYGTGFAVFALRASNQVPAGDARIRQGVDWLKSHQRASGGWYTRSPKNRDALSSYVGTAYAVLALKACGEIPDG